MKGTLFVLQYFELKLKMEVQKQEVKPEFIWIFGYGSLCWNPGFEFLHSMTGYVKGYSRRFWQGNTTHRGTEAKPGRVATLIAERDGITWGRAFLVSSKNTAALPYLSNRECKLGGYEECTVDFYPKPASTSSSSTELPKTAVLYIATAENKHWLGSAKLTDIAKQILECHGPSGPNVEYLLKLAEFMRDEVPEALDDHLFSLERLVHSMAVQMGICLRTLMGAERSEPRNNNQFASRVPEKKLRCVNM